MRSAYRVCLTFFDESKEHHVWSNCDGMLLKSSGVCNHTENGVLQPYGSAVPRKLRRLLREMLRKNERNPTSASKTLQQDSPSNTLPDIRFQKTMTITLTTVVPDFAFSSN